MRNAIDTTTWRPRTARRYLQAVVCIFHQYHVDLSKYLYENRMNIFYW